MRCDVAVTASVLYKASDLEYSFSSSSSLQIASLTGMFTLRLYGTDPQSMTMPRFVVVVGV